MGILGLSQSTCCEVRPGVTPFHQSTEESAEIGVEVDAY